MFPNLLPLQNIYRVPTRTAARGVLQKPHWMGGETASGIMLDDPDSSQVAWPFQISIRASQAGVKRFHLHERPSHRVVVVCEPQLEHSRRPSQGSRAAASPCAMRSSAALLSCMQMSRLSKFSAACVSRAVGAACVVSLMAQLGIYVECAAVAIFEATCSKHTCSSSGLPAISMKCSMMKRSHVAARCCNPYFSAYSAHFSAMPVRPYNTCHTALLLCCLELCTYTVKFQGRIPSCIAICMGTVGICPVMLRCVST